MRNAHLTFALARAPNDAMGPRASRPGQASVSERDGGPPRERNALIATPRLFIGCKWQILCDLRIALAHDDTIADFEGHQVLTNLQRAAISFARSRHDIIDSCPRNLVAG